MTIQELINILSELPKDKKVYTDNIKVNFRGEIVLTHEDIHEKNGDEKHFSDFKAEDWYVSKVGGKIHNMTYNPTDKVEPKFKVGDWVVLTVGELSTTLQIVNVDTNKRLYWFNDSSYLPIVDEECLHHWTIQDAKDGDVLVNGSNIFIFHFLNDTRLMGYCHVNTDDGRFYDDLGKNECFCLIDGIVTPATKEQRDLLFQKMKEAGYEWEMVYKNIFAKSKADFDATMQPDLWGKRFDCEKAIKEYFGL